MKKIVVASKNPVKLNAALKAFERMFPGESFEIHGVSVPSGVPEQPKSDKETLMGARNRAENASNTHAEADFWVGMEGGIEDAGHEMGSFGWMVVKGKNGSFGKGRTGTFFLPPKVAALIKEGKELGEADDIVFGGTNSKQKNGAIGILTSNAIDRTAYYSDALMLALIPFKNEHLYPNA